MPYRLTRALLYPTPWRVRLLQSLLRRLPILDYKTRLDFDLVPRPHYGYCMYRAALEARDLGYPSISVLEFGVGAGHGLLVAEFHKERIEDILGIGIEIYGFDLGDGLPPPADYRDMPQFWREGFYRMDVDTLKARLNHSRLILGRVGLSAKSFLAERRPAPIGTIFFDLDYYSSTKEAFAVLEGASATRLPRIFAYFDDIIGREFESFHEFGGELLAIKEFNEKETNIKIARENGLIHKRKNPARWNDQIFIIHDFDHPKYGTYIDSAPYKGKVLS